jgi:hypothetical protein
MDLRSQKGDAPAVANGRTIGYEGSANIDPAATCGTDIHTPEADIPAVVNGRIIGYEGSGNFTETASSSARKLEKKTSV